ncbi:hypothetical protein AALP_AA2G107000 [Arabis alpina]|uniref:Uncharacterized protein n=1 Tax=Arabis alpina TaxID=50452 RepID=A0A087HGL1_ARAAL|nr:hypothetical protein AALP_AA2G107000 [Arabis alpina]
MTAEAGSPPLDLSKEEGIANNGGGVELRSGGFGGSGSFGGRRSKRSEKGCVTGEEIFGLVNGEEIHVSDPLEIHIDFLRQRSCE